MRFRKLIKRVAFCALIVCAAPIFSSSARGELITNVLTVSDFSETTSPVGQFGAPSVVGNSLKFPNINLDSVSTGRTDTNYCSMIITSTNAMESLDFGEGGNLGVFSSGEYAKAKINVTGYLEILAGDGVGDIITASGFSKLSESTGIGHDLVDWGGDLVFNLQGKNVTQVRVTVQNEVYTSNNAGTFAFVGATVKAASISVVPVPEPSSIILLGMGAVALVFVRKRK